MEKIIKERQRTMADTRAVKDPKNGVVSCWVCTAVMIIVNLVRVYGLRNHSTIAAIVIGILIAIWVVISVVETIKYMKYKKKLEEINGRKKD